MEPSPGRGQEALYRQVVRGRPEWRVAPAGATSRNSSSSATREAQPQNSSGAHTLSSASVCAQHPLTQSLFVEQVAPQKVP